ncbi:MAG: hypothetical protein KGQ48_10020, partial [Bradyrhizobium sp.]|nr:hypothetical protein [Bradyrhizobium sp.]
MKKTRQNKNLERRSDSIGTENALVVATAHRFVFDGDFGVAQGHHCEKQRAGEPADHGTKWHEGEEHQHAAIAFKIAGLEDFDPGEACPDAEGGTAQRAQHQTQQCKQRDLHGGISPLDASSPAVWSRWTAERFNAAAKKKMSLFIETRDPLSVSCQRFISAFIRCP